MRWAHDDKLFVSNSSNRRCSEAFPYAFTFHRDAIIFIQFSLAAGRHSSSY